MVEEVGTHAQAKGLAGRNAGGRCAASVGCGLSIFGTGNTHWACPTSAATSSTTCAPKIAARLAAHDGQNDRV